MAADYDGTYNAYIIDVFEDDLRIFGNGGATPGVTLTAGATSWSAMSDIRVKKNIEPLENVLDKIDSIKGVRFKYKDDPTEKEHLGVIAQDVRQVFPELVDETGDSDYLNVKYALLAPVAIQGLKEMKEIVHHQQETIERQEELIRRLSARLDAIEDK